MVTVSYSINISGTLSMRRHMEDITLGLRNTTPLLDQISRAILNTITNNFLSEGTIFQAGGWPPLAIATLQHKTPIKMEMKFTPETGMETPSKRIELLKSRQLFVSLPTRYKRRIHYRMTQHGVSVKGLKEIGIKYPAQKRMMIETGNLMGSWIVILDAIKNAVTIRNTAMNKYGDYYAEFHQQMYGTYRTKSGKPYPQRKILPDIEKDGLPQDLQIQIYDLIEIYLRSLGIYRREFRFRPRATFYWDKYSVYTSAEVMPELQQRQGGV